MFTGGGTAGHIFPLVAIARELKRNYPFAGFEFLYLGPKDKFAKEILLNEDIEVKTILFGKIRRYFSFWNILDIFKMPIGFLQAFYYVFVFSPDLIFSKGGYGSIPAVIAGWVLQTPVFLHEADIIPGVANKIASKFAVEIFISFSIEETEYFPAKKMLSVGNPIRSRILTGSRKKARELFNLTREKPVILILGGSQGAQSINNKILAILPQILNDFEVIHQTGQKNIDQVRKEADVILTESTRKYYHAEGFLKDDLLPHALRAADLVISRAGSGSIFEITAVGKPCILIPLPNSAQGHQIRNAYALSKRGAAIVVEEENFRPHFILERIKYIFSKPELMQELSKRAKDFSRPQAAKIIAEYLITYLSQ